MKVNRLLILVFGLLTMLSGSILKAQEVQVVDGQVLVQVLSGHTGEEVASFLNEQTGNTAKARSLRELSHHMKIWQIAFDDDAISMDEALRIVWAAPMVTVAQFNHKLSNRATLPNDANISSQWQYVNTGQSGGTPGADIDMDLAWDITTGGLTALGDTIVACVIDDGLNQAHQDFGNNVWVNHNEIPNNNIDDDGNGFVDDYLGWDAYNSNDNIYQGGGHGTPVAGIVGAKGNNGVGVAGVNWDVKLMIVRGGGNEAAAIAAYSYPLEMRKLYNQSNGTLGAYVVTTNASWGVDYGQPSAAPLWCAMYDTLGAYGVVSCGATANIGIDIDQQGDLPTACPSDYLISVTNMNHNDNKVNSAGWGATTIDLGAFGQNAYTTSSPNGYGGFGGTSGATPHVTGTVALLYSAPCTNLAAVAKTNPDSAAILVKQFILDGVDANTSLNNITTTGGRLNVHKALLQLQGWDCNGTGCISAFSLNVSNVVDTSATINWASTATADSFHVQFRPVGTSTWVDFYTQNTSRNIDTLQACTQYEFRVETFCDTSTAAFTPVTIFQTDGCCEAPTGYVDSAYIAGAVISFDPVLAAQSYTLRYRITGSSNWTTVPGLTSPQYNLSPLDSCAEYEYQVQTVCDTGATPFSSSSTFRTEGCIGCEATYCDAFSNDDTEEWINQVSLSNVNNYSTGNNNGYQDFTGQFSIMLKRDSIYDITLSPAFANFPFDEYFQVFIDLNQDSDFDDQGEMVYSVGPIQSATTGQVQLPLSTPLGITRMRVTMRYDQPASYCEAGYGFGEVEDYCVEVLPEPIVSITDRLEDQVRIYPNPFQENLNISFTNEFAADCHLTLFDVQGKAVRKQSYKNLSAGAIDLQLATSGLKPGMYFLDVQVGNDHVRRKLTMIK